MNDTIICKNQKISEGSVIFISFEFKNKIRIGKFKVHSLNLDIPRYPTGTWANIRLAPVYGWDRTMIEIRDNLTYLDLDPNDLEDILKTEEEWLDFVRSPEFSI